MFLTIVGLLFLINIIVWFMRKLRIGNYGNRYVFITGCDTGFGNLLAKQLDTLGFRVFAGCLTDIGLEEIRTSCSERVLPISIDVTKEKSIQEAVSLVKRRLPDRKGLWAIVNNAGIGGSFGPTSWQTRQDYLDCMDVNLFGVISVTKAFLPLVLMEKGRVVNMSSGAGRLAVLPVYSLTKFGVEAFSDCLRYEMYYRGISVHILEPGFFSTNISDQLESKIIAKVNSLPPEIRETISDNKLRKEDGVAPDQKVQVRMLIWSYTSRKWRRGPWHPALDDTAEFFANSSKQTFLVADAYTHAITARFPKVRYVVGNDCKYIFRPLWMLPEWISDFVIATVLKMKRQF